MTIDGLEEIEHPGALGHGRQPRRHGVPQLGQQARVGRQRARVHFGEAAAEVERAGASGQCAITDGVEHDGFETSRAHHLERLGVTEREGTTPSDGDDGGVPPGRRRRRRQGCG